MIKKILSLAFFLLPFLGFSQNCNPFFTAYDSANCTVFFYPQTQSTPVNWSIDFGDNTSQTQSNSTTFYPTHQYAQNGIYTVLLTVYNSNTCYDTFSTSVTVNSCSSSSACQVYMSNQISLCTASFSAYANTANNTFTWDFGDNSTGTGSAVTHTYANPGNYNVCVVSMDPSGCSDTLCQTVTILSCSQNCNPYFTAVDSVNCTVFFYPQTQSTPVNWSIDFGDNTSQTQSNSTTFYPSHQYAQNGIYTVSLAVYSSNLCYDTFSTTIIVNSCNSSSACQVYMTNQVSLCTATFYAYANTANNTFAWDFGDNSTGTGSAVTHTYANPGVYTVCVVSMDTTGCSDTLCQAITVQSCTQPCDATFSVSDSLCSITVVALNNYSTPMNWYCDFGDNNYMTHYGNSLTGMHNYAQSGSYTMSLMVWDSLCADTFSQTVTVNCPINSNCTPDFSYQIYQCTAYYYVISPVNTAMYAWDFGDNFGTGSGTSATYAYSQNGTYNVCLTMYDSANNCYASYCDPVTITGCSSSNGPCDASFSVYVDSMDPCTVTVLTVGQNYPMNYYVNFGDGNDDYTLNYYYGNWTNTYSGSGPWNICVTIWDSSCADTVCQTIVLQGCGPNSIQDNSNIITPKVTVSPAPFRDVMEIQVTHPEMVDHITVFDLSGKAQLSEQVNGRNIIQLNTSAIAEGMYLLEIKEVSGKQQLKKIVKQ